MAEHTQEMMADHDEKFVGYADEVKTVECGMQEIVGSPSIETEADGKVADEVKFSKIVNEIKYSEVADEDKPSFIDILKSRPNISLEKEKKEGNVVREENNSYARVIIPQFGSYKPTQQPALTPVMVVDDTLMMREVSAAEKRLQAATLVKIGIQQQVGSKEAVCKKSKEVYEAALSAEKVVKSSLKAQNIKISQAQFMLKELKKFGCPMDLLGQSFDQDCTTLKSAALADSIKSIQTALLSSGLGIHDLDWNEFSDELLKPMKKVTLLLKEDIQKAEALTKGSKKNYDNRAGELKILKARLRGANSVLQEANRDLMRLQNKTFPERRKEDLKEACDGDNKLTKYESKPSCLEQMDLGNIDNELCKDVGSNSVKAIQNKDSCIEETVDSPYKCNAGQTPKLEDGCSSQSEQGIECEDGYKNEELDDFDDSGLLVEDTKEAEEEKVVELSEIEQAKETTNNDNRNSLPAEPHIEKRKASLKSKKKEKRKTRKARRKGERFVSCMKLPQACLASLGLYLIGYYLLRGCSFGFQ